ncbi:hypothetical protein NXV73_13695 [Bacteroides salyersiae]|nr:hypothetical protein [Bacteroides salyersiae]
MIQVSEYCHQTYADNIPDGGKCRIWNVCMFSPKEHRQPCRQQTVEQVLQLIQAELYSILSYSSRNLKCKINKLPTAQNSNKYDDNQKCNKQFKYLKQNNGINKRITAPTNRFLSLLLLPPPLE